jgi:hypothetical protein
MSMAGGSFYEPAFGRVFSRLALTPARLGGLTAALAVGAYCSPGPSSPAVALLFIGAGLSLAHALATARVAYVGVIGLVVVSAFLFSPGALFVVWAGLGGAVALIVAAESWIQRDHAFDNFDRMIAVCAGALTWSTLGAWATVRVDPTLSIGVPPSAIGAAVFGSLLAVVVIVGDARRARWLRRLRAGRMRGYVVRNAAEGGHEAKVPALVGGWMPANSVLVLCQDLSTGPFRSGSRESTVARVPAKLGWLISAIYLRLVAMSVVAIANLALAIAALTG